MPTQYVTLDASGSSSTTLNDAPEKTLQASVASSPLLTRSSIRYLKASAGSAASVFKLVGHTFSASISAIASYVEKHWGPRPFAVVRAENNWIMADTNQWLVISTNNWTQTVLGD